MLQHLINIQYHTFQTSPPICMVALCLANWIWCVAITRFQRQRTPFRKQRSLQLSACTSFWWHQLGFAMPIRHSRGWWTPYSMTYPLLSFILMTSLLQVKSPHEHRNHLRYVCKLQPKMDQYSTKKSPSWVYHRYCCFVAWLILTALLPFQLK